MSASARNAYAIVGCLCCCCSVQMQIVLVNIYSVFWLWLQLHWHTHFFCNRLFSDLWICVAHFMGENERKYSKALLIDPLAPLTLFTNRRLKVLHSSFFRISFYESCTIFSSGHRAICLVIEWILVHQQLLCCFVSPFALLNLLHKLFFVIFF